MSERQSKSDSAVQGLPWYPNRPVGRDDDVAAIVDLDAEESPRIVTLTGPGGVGKTRLAVEVAPLLVDRFPDDVYFVDLSAISWPLCGIGSGRTMVAGGGEVEGFDWGRSAVLHHRGQCGGWELLRQGMLRFAQHDVGRSVISGRTGGDGINRKLQGDRHEVD